MDRLLEQARAKLRRVSPPEARVAMDHGAALIDIRSDTQRQRDGVIPGARLIARNELEWRCDPSSEWRDPEVAQPDRQLIVMCNEGYQSSLAAATLQELGIGQATDLIGGFQAWRAAGLPVEAPPSKPG